MATCFVVQGFGKKTDFTDGRVLDLDASYAIIKEAVEAAGLACLRADEIAHAGTIDAPMYRELFEADLVIADLSTYNVNAAFELGIRYGLRHRATIIIAEDQFKNPFDVGHIVIRRYKHLGEDIGVKEARRFGDELKQAITHILSNREVDSPVYTFLPGLVPPHMAQCDPTLAGSPGPTLLHSRMSVPPAADAPANAKSLLDDALGRIACGDFANARHLLAKVRKQRPNDSFVIQQQALATYKSRHPTSEAALLAARDILAELAPATTNDPETLGLWSAIHKRLWELNHQEPDLDESIAVCERGFHLKQDYYNGINLAHLLDLRALNALRAGEREEGMADAVMARRTRRRVIQYAQSELDRDMSTEKRFWIFSTLREAAEGLGDTDAAARWLAAAQALEVPAWMLDTSAAQIGAMRSALDEIARLGAIHPQ